MQADPAKIQEGLDKLEAAEAEAAEQRYLDHLGSASDDLSDSSGTAAAADQSHWDDERFGPWIRPNSSAAAEQRKPAEYPPGSLPVPDGLHAATERSVNVQRVEPGELALQMEADPVHAAAAQAAALRRPRDQAKNPLIPPNFASSSAAAAAEGDDVSSVEESEADSMSIRPQSASAATASASAVARQELEDQEAALLLSDDPEFDLEDQESALLLAAHQTSGRQDQESALPLLQHSGAGREHPEPASLSAEDPESTPGIQQPPLLSSQGRDSDEEASDASAADQQPHLLVGPDTVEKQQNVDKEEAPPLLMRSKPHRHALDNGSQAL